MPSGPCRLPRPSAAVPSSQPALEAMFVLEAASTARFTPRGRGTGAVPGQGRGGTGAGGAGAAAPGAVKRSRGCPSAAAAAARHEGSARPRGPPAPRPTPGQPVSGNGGRPGIWGPAPGAGLARDMGTGSGTVPGYWDRSREDWPWILGPESGLALDVSTSGYRDQEPDRDCLCI